MLDGVCGLDKHVDERTVDVHVVRLRRMVCPGRKINPVRAVLGAGYFPNGRFSGSPWCHKTDGEPDLSVDDPLAIPTPVDGLLIGHFAMVLTIWIVSFCVISAEMKIICCRITMRPLAGLLSEIHQFKFFAFRRNHVLNLNSALTAVGCG